MFISCIKNKEHTYIYTNTKENTILNVRFVNTFQNILFTHDARLTAYIIIIYRICLIKENKHHGFTTHIT